MIKLWEICKMFVEFLKNSTEFTSIDFGFKDNKNFEIDMLWVYHSLKKEEKGYMSEVQTLYFTHKGFSDKTELVSGNRYWITINLKTFDLDKNKETKKKVEDILNQLKQKGFKLKYSRYFFDYYYGILEKI